MHFLRKKYDEFHDEKKTIGRRQDRSGRRDGGLDEDAWKTMQCTDETERERERERENVMDDAQWQAMDRSFRTAVLL